MTILIVKQFVLFTIQEAWTKMKPKYYAYNPKGAAKYAKDKGLDDKAEKRRQSAMVMEADLNDQSKGAIDFINKKYGKTGSGFFSSSDYNNYQEFENSVLDVMSEGEISSLFPPEVWQRAAKRYTKQIFKPKSTKK